MNPRILVALVLLGAGCFSPEVDADAGFRDAGADTGLPDSGVGADAGVDAGGVWSWSGTLVSVSTTSTTLAGSLQSFCTSSWFVDIATRRFDFDECPRGGATMRRTGQRDLTEEELNRFVVAMRSMPLATPGCNNELGWSRMTVTTSTASFNLGDVSHCSSTDRTIVDFVPVFSVMSSWPRTMMNDDAGVDAGP
jgi:hypothetical protein